MCGVTAATLAPWQLWLLAHAEQRRRLVEWKLRDVHHVARRWASGGGFSFIIQTILLNAREVGALLADHFALGDGQRARMVASVFVVSLVASERGGGETSARLCRIRHRVFDDPARVAIYALALRLRRVACRCVVHR